MSDTPLPTNVKIIFRCGDYFLYIRLPKNGYNFPGGHLEPGEQPLAGLRREVQEELGYTFEGELQSLGAWTSVNDDGDIHRITIAYLYDLPAKVDFHWQGGPQDENFEAFVWVHPEDLAQQGLSPKYVEIMTAAAQAPHR